MTHRFQDEWLLPVVPILKLPEDVVQGFRDAGEPNFAQALFRRHLAEWPAFAAAFKEAFAFEAADVTVKDVEKLALTLLTQDVCERLHVLPLRITNDAIVLAMSNPFDLEAKNQVALLSARTVEPRYALPEKVEALVAECYSHDMLMVDLIEKLDVNDKAEFVDSGSGVALEAAGTIERLVHDLITKAVLMGAAEIQMDHGKNASEVRYLLDGMLRPILTLPKAAAAGPVAARIKAMAGLDVTERFRPQEGRVILRVAGRELGLRVFTRIGPTGEKITLRILDERIAALPLDKLGFRAARAAKLQEALAGPGLVLVAGPAGSGKTSTLYALLNQLKNQGLTLATVEDPIEFKLSGVPQTQVNDKQGLNYPTALRSTLRGDPQAILLGEIRDAETAGLALAAAATRRVLAAVHTEDGFQTLTRLVDMGIEPAKVAPALRQVLTQRLVRRFCPCRKAGEKIDPAVEAAMKEEKLEPAFYRPSGCEECNFTGYRGRLALLEVLEMSEAVKEKLIAGGHEKDLREAAGEAFHSLRGDALAHVAAGDAPLPEVMPFLGLKPAAPAAKAPEPAPAKAPEKTIAKSPERIPEGPIVIPTSAVPEEGMAIPMTTDAPAPAPSPRQEKPAAATEPASPEPRTARRILVTDDDAIIRAVLKKALTAQGFEVAEAPDGVTALSRIAEKMPDLLLLDLEMPGMDGYGVIKMIRRRMGMMKLPIVMLTAAEDEKHQKQALELGADDFVLKPFKPADLLNRVEAVFRRAQTA